MILLRELKETVVHADGKAPFRGLGKSRTEDGVMVKGLPNIRGSILGTTYTKIM